MNVTTSISPVQTATASVMAEVFAKQQQLAVKLRTSTAEERIAKLRRLEAAVMASKEAIYRALAEDLHKPATEADLDEIMPVIGEIHHAVKHLRSWMRTKRVGTTMTMLGTQARIRYQPRGVCLIISPWNFPINLTFGPLASAIAAGNTVIIKPSELTPSCSALMAEIIRQTFDPAEIAVFEGDAAVSTALLALPFDHMFFTGSPAVGKIVMAAAAKHLSSITLELGGKSPVIVDASADLTKAAKSIMWGKFLNNGQTCVAPDYLYVHEKILPAFLEKAKTAIAKMYGDNVQTSPDYCRIVNDRHFSRIKNILDDATANGATVVTGGTMLASDKFIAPTLLTNVRLDSAVMQEEIFGPVLPIVTYSDINEPIAHINANPKPLALYVYSKDQVSIDKIIDSTSSGGVGINVSVLHFSHANLPFGGVNNSGIGSSHGEYGFKAFSHERAVMRDQYNSTPMLYPPYTPRVKWLMGLTLKFFS
ncbi:MAG TPA: aldehyde dehydrogenase family protein [Acidocella sp.]|nr:MAG: aldehyde dehydrogenase [Acidocella sp. 20-58-15]HQT38582.1 aldehyde dehydrogenase family protein [Acidocella sp.]